jgi:RND family efflux transporter MFP subunit
MSRAHLFVLSLFALSACGRGGEKLTELPAADTRAEAAAPVAVSTLQVSRKTVSRPVVANGTTEPIRAADLGPQLTARVDAVLVDEGDFVKAGAPLVRLDVVSASLRVEQSNAQLESLKSQYENAQSEVARLSPLVAQGSVTPQQIERLTAQRDALKASLDAARVATADAQHTVTNAIVRAPFSGIVSRVSVEVGEVATMTPAKVLVRLVDLSSLDVRVRVHERELSRIALGAKVVARFPSGKGQVEGAVQFISPEIDPRTRSAEVVARIPNPDGALRAGMFTEISATPTEAAACLVLPTEAIAGTGDSRYAFVVTDGVASKRPVKTSPIDAKTLEVLEGLSEGDVVVASGLGRLSDGAKVRLGAEKQGASAEHTP